MFSSALSVGHEVEALEDEPDACAPQLRELVVGEAGEVLAVDAHGAARSGRRAGSCRSRPRVAARGRRSPGASLAALAAGVCVAQARRRPVAAILGFSLALVAAVALGNSDLDQDNPLLLIPYFLLPVTWAANTDHRTFVRTAPLVVVLFPLAIVLNNPSSASARWSSSC